MISCQLGYHKKTTFFSLYCTDVLQFSGPGELCGSWEEYKEVEQKHPEEAEKRLKAAQKLLSIWALELEAKPQVGIRNTSNTVQQGLDVNHCTWFSVLF